MSRLAVLCDPDGCITRVLVDDDALLASDAAGSPLSWSLADHAIASFYELLGLLVEEPVICTWRLDLERLGVTTTCDVAAARERDVILLAGGRDPFAASPWPELNASPIPGVPALAERIAERASDREACVVDLQRQIATLSAQTQSVDKLENTLIRVAAHDLRNPILVLRMNCSFLLQHDSSLDAGARGVVQEMQETCDYMDRFLDGMTSLSQVWVGALPLYREPVDGRQLLARVTRECGDLAAARDIAVDLVHADQVVFTADVRKLTRVLHELLGNAISSCPDGSVIEARLIADSDGHADIHIDDNGPGITPEVLDHLFRPFGKSPSTSRTGYGAGVGLPIARRIVEAHGGTLTVASQPGTGTRVTVKLPTVAER